MPKYCFEIHLINITMSAYSHYTHTHLVVVRNVFYQLL